MFKKILLISALVLPTMASAANQDTCEAQFNAMKVALESVANGEFLASSTEVTKAKSALEVASNAASDGDYCKAIQLAFEN